MSEDVGRDPRVTMAEERTGWAMFRTSMSMDRTTLAWVRTTLAMSSFGLGTIGFFRSLRMENQTPESVRLHEWAIHFGVTLVVIGVVSTVLVAVAHARNVKKLRSGEVPQVGRWPLSLTISLLLALLALYGLWTLFLR